MGLLREGGAQRTRDAGLPVGHAQVAPKVSEIGQVEFEDRAAVDFGRPERYLRRNEWIPIAVTPDP